MLLAVDVGNTNIVFGLFDGDVLIKSWRQETYSELKTFSDLPEFKSVIVGSVVPAVDELLRKFFADHYKISPVFVDHQNAKIEIKVDDPAQVGADRLINAIAAKVLYKSPAVVIDFGTATTFDVVDGGGAYVGGVIAPGVHLSLKALEQAAAKLPMVEVQKPASVTGKTTKDAMQAGIYFGYLGLVEKILNEIAKEQGQKTFVIATGGLAGFFGKDNALIDVVDPDLTLKGLRIIYRSMCL